MKLRERTIEEINEKIKEGTVVVLTAEEVIELAKEEGYKKAAEKVDVVTTGTFGPMCSSGVFINFGHTSPRIKKSRAWLNDVPAYGGLAAVDIYIGATAIPENDPANTNYPGEFKYGGGHVIEDLVRGKDILLYAESYGTDCYPRKELETYININTINEAILFNPRNAYQNYNVAVNLSNRTIYTYMGVLKPNLGNANYCSAGQLSPLLKDPLYETIGVGTRIFLGGGIGYVALWGTQHSPAVPRNEIGIPKVPAGTLALIGDLKQMSPQWLRGVSMRGYGVSLAVGVGVPIPILNEEIFRRVSASDEEITAPVVDYSDAYPNRKGDILAEVTYAQLRSGEIELLGKKVPTASLSSYYKAREIAIILKNWIKEGAFLLTQPVQPIPGPESGMKMKPCEIRRPRLEEL
jgi:uncharacterized protein (DUF39 family)